MNAREYARRQHDAYPSAWPACGVQQGNDCEGYVPADDTPRTVLWFAGEGGEPWDEYLRACDPCREALMGAATKHAPLENWNVRVAWRDPEHFEVVGLFDEDGDLEPLPPESPPKCEPVSGILVDDATPF